MRLVSTLIAIAALVLCGGSSRAALTRSAGPLASATQVNGPQAMTVWITFADGSRWAGMVSWFGSPESIDWSSATVVVYENGRMRVVSSWWLAGATVTYRPTTTIYGDR